MRKPAAPAFRACASSKSICRVRNYGRFGGGAVHAPSLQMLPSVAVPQVTELMASPVTVLIAKATVGPGGFAPYVFAPTILFVRTPRIGENHDSLSTSAAL